MRLQDDEMLDITMKDISQPLKFKKKPRRSGSSSASRGSSPAVKAEKGSPARHNKRNNTGDISDLAVAAWRNGGEDMELSTKMLSLLEYLKEAEKINDKTICYSQCMFPSTFGA